MAWKFNDASPIYAQIIESIKHLIINGTYKPGDKLPAVRDLAVEAGVNPNTIQRAFQDLEREELVKSDRTSGRYVTDNLEKIEELKKELSKKYVNDLFENLSQLGMGEKEIKKIVSEWKGDN